MLTGRGFWQFDSRRLHHLFRLVTLEENTHFRSNHDCGTTGEIWRIPERFGTFRIAIVVPRVVPFACNEGESCSARGRLQPGPLVVSPCAYGIRVVGESFAMTAK